MVRNKIKNDSPQWKVRMIWIEKTMGSNRFILYLRKLFAELMEFFMSCKMSYLVSLSKIKTTTSNRYDESKCIENGLLSGDALLIGYKYIAVHWTNSFHYCFVENFVGYLFQRSQSIDVTIIYKNNCIKV